MYYTDYGDSPHISQASYEGTNIIVIENSDLVFPTGLAADFSSKWLSQTLGSSFSSKIYRCVSLVGIKFDLMHESMYVQNY